MKGYNAFFIVLVSVLASRGPMVQGVIPPSSPPPPPVDVDCDYGYALHKVRSQYSTVAPDRHWQWECIKITDHDSLKPTCKWYDGINDDQEPIVFRCPKKHYMAGIRSTFRIDDRIWDVKCCKAADICPSDCYLSYCLNDLQEDIDYCAKENGVFVGIYSDFDPTDLYPDCRSLPGQIPLPPFHSRDRVWKIEQCQAKKCPLFPGVELDYTKRSAEEEEKEEEKEEQDEE